MLAVASAGLLVGIVDGQNSSSTELFTTVVLFSITSSKVDNAKVCCKSTNRKFGLNFKHEMVAPQYEDKGERCLFLKHPGTDKNNS